VSLDTLKEYLSICDDNLIWEPFYDDSMLLDEFSNYIKEIELSKEWNKSKNHEKGKILEQLVRFIMSRFTILSDISVNKSTTDNELDVFVKFNDNIPIPFLCNIKSKIVCECKNWKSRKVDVGMVSKLAEICNKNNAGLGIFISLNGLTGKGWQYAEGKRRKLYLSDKMPIISFTVDEITKLKYKRYNLLTMIKCKMQALIDEMEFAGGELRLLESELGFIDCLNENIESLKMLGLITEVEYNNIKVRINHRYDIVN